jgi:hypothetical protein
MKRQNIALFFLLLCIVSVLTLYLTNGPTLITDEDAIDDGFPIYMPSDDLLQSMGISNSPIITKERNDRLCTYLNVDLYYENPPVDQDDEKPALHMVVSNGCAYRYVPGYRTELSWAVGGKAMRIGDDFVDQLPPIIAFVEPTLQFQYVVFSEETLDNTMKLLESMKLLK